MTEPRHTLTLGSAAREPIECPCGWKIYDGEMVRSRCVNLRNGMALCRCKRWITVPISGRRAAPSAAARP